MSSVNKVILIGNLGKDPETRFMTNGDPVTNISLATTEAWKDKNGEKQEKTEWHKISAYRKLAEIMDKYLKKGSQVYIEGKLATRKWTDKNGMERYTTEIIASDMKMLGNKQADSSDSGQSSASHYENTKSGSNSGFEDMEDDINW